MVHVFYIHMSTMSRNAYASTVAITVNDNTFEGEISHDLLGLFIM